MPADRTAIVRTTAQEKRAAALFVTHTGLRALLKPMLGRFSYTSYFRHHDANTAKTYIEGQWENIRGHLRAVPPTFTTNLKEVDLLKSIGWVEPHAAGGEFYRWKAGEFGPILADGSLETFLGAAGYARFWGMVYFAYLRGVYSEMKIEDTLSNDQAEQILLSERRFAAGDYGAMFGREVQRVWAPQQAVNWAMEQIKVGMADLKDSHRLIAAMLVRVYTGVHSTPELRKVYGNWRAGMASAPRVSLAMED